MLFLKLFEKHIFVVFIYGASLLPSFARWFDIWNQINAVNHHTDTQLKTPVNTKQTVKLKKLIDCHMLSVELDATD